MIKPTVKECGVRIKEFFFGKTNSEPTKVPAANNPLPKPPSFAKAKSFNDIVKASKPALPLIGNLIRSGERVVLFSFTGQGKSVLAMQWAIELAEGKKSCILPVDYETPQAHKQHVVIYDAEQDEDDIYQRYEQHGFVFPANFKRLEGLTFETAEQLLKDIRSRVKTFPSDGVVVVDNITAICPSFTAEKVREFYGGLKGIQSEAQNRSITITFIIVGHTTKTQDWQPLAECDLAGSSNLSNFATSIFALGPTKWENTKLLKQLKGRKVPKKSTVSLLEIQEKPYLHFQYLREEDEAAALKPKPKPVKDTSPVAEFPVQAGTPQKVVDLQTVKAIIKLKDDGKKDKQIEKAIHFSRKTVGQVLNQVHRLNDAQKKAQIQILLEQGKTFAEVGKALGCRPAVVEYVKSLNN